MNQPSPADSSGQCIARRCYVSGRVQGVNYRACARRQALAAGITGQARNLPDGRVEIVVWGAPAAVQAFIEWLWIGSSAAKVSAVLVEELDARAAERPGDFSTA